MNLPGVLGLLAVLVLGILFLFFRIVRRAGILAISVSIAIFGYHLWRMDKYARGFESSHPGSSREEVEALMGPPADITDCSPGVYSTHGVAAKQIPGCAQLFWYHSFLLPEQWLYAFNSQGKVIFQYEYSSP
jgi:hypothetical protein